MCILQGGIQVAQTENHVLIVAENQQKEQYRAQNLPKFCNFLLSCLWNLIFGFSLYCTQASQALPQHDAAR